MPVRTLHREPAQRYAGDQAVLHDVAAGRQPVPAADMHFDVGHLRRGEPGLPGRRHQLHLPRLSSLILTGDQKQLPPTSFFR